jgi:uncharacterized membrane protein YedE/YeeE
MSATLLAIILGTAFGFAIHRVGASNPSGIINMLRLKDMHLMRVIFFSIAVASTIIFIGMASGFVDSTHMSIKSMNWGVIIGGMIFGLGWGVAGYCPGTAVCALGEGRKDALFFILGALLGSYFFMLGFDFLKDSFLFDSLFGGKVLLADMTPKNATPLISAVPAVATALIVAIVFSAIAYFLPTAKEPEKL